MSVRKNIIANFMGQCWRAAMTLAFLPIYISYLGVEAYGLIGFFALLQVWLALLDVGMRPALSREMAKFKAGATKIQQISDLLRSIEIITTITAVVATICIFLATGWIVQDWLNLQTISTGLAIETIKLMGIVGALRFFENIYTSCISGLQHQSLQNAISILTATIQAFGSVLVLKYISATIDMFFYWQLLVAIISVMVSRAVLYRLLPKPDRTATFSLSSLRQIWRFSSGVMIILLLATVLTQLDKVVLLKLLPLESFGYYAFASSIANSLCLLATPVTQAYYPRFSELVAQNDSASLASAFHKGTQLIVVLMGSAAVWLAFFSRDLMYIWTGDASLASNVGPIVSILAIGTFLNGLIWMPSQLQLAFGWTKLGVYENVVGVLVMTPLILWATPKYGAISAAWVWLILNLGYLFVGTQVMFKKYLTREKFVWYKNDIGIPIVSMVIVGGIFSYYPIESAEPFKRSIILAFIGLAIGLSGLMVSPCLKNTLILKMGFSK